MNAVSKYILHQGNTSGSYTLSIVNTLITKVKTPFFADTIHVIIYYKITDSICRKGAFYD